MTSTIILSSGTRFENAEERIREYCEIEVYRGYDDLHNINNSITMNDIRVANELYAMIDSYDPTESSRIVGAVNVEAALKAVDDLDLALMNGGEWAALMPKLRILLSEFTRIKGVGIAKATKILHLKRPYLFPVLDSFVVKFLTGKDPTLVLEKERSLELGLDALSVVRVDLATNVQGFRELGANLLNLPITLTYARMYDILCWTQEKWVVRGNRHSKFGVAARSVA